MEKQVSKYDITIERAKKEIGRLEGKEFTFYFYVYDSRGVAKGSLAYIYETAFQLKELGYNVAMIYSDETKSGFVGVKDWLGNKYAELPHKEVKTVSTQPTDFVVIPEFYANIMYSTTPGRDKEGKPTGLYCKRIVLSQDVPYITEVMPEGRRWGDYQLFDCVTTSETQKEIIAKYFPYVKTKVVNPSVSPVFRPLAGKQKSLAVAICTRDESLARQITRGFYLKYPQYKWVSFNDLKGFSQEVFADELRKCCAVVWDDPTTDWGYTAIEAIKSDTVVVGRLPENIPDWAKNAEGNLSNAVAWYNSPQEAIDLICATVESYLTDSLPAYITEDMNLLKGKYTRDEFKKGVAEIWGGYVEQSMGDLKALIDDVEKKKELLKDVTEQSNG